jgi:predicted ATPase
VLLVATARPEFTTPWPARSNLSTVQLARLTKRQARDMITTLAGAKLPADTVDVLVARGDGVPLYLEELTKPVMDPGTAHRVEDIPASLADSLMARLDRLSAAKEVAQRAAVLGREFGYPLLAAVTDIGEAALRQGLERLADAEILFARGEPPATTYTFKHALIQETAYQSLLKRTRQQLHARTAQVLEERFPERAASEPELIARHYDHAGLIERAVTHYQRAGERATERSANEEAIGRLRRALDLVATLPETRERDQMEFGLQMAIGAPLMAARGWSHPENEQTYARARELASHIGGSPELARVLVGLSAALSIKGEFATSLEVAREALTAAERTGAAFDLVSAHEEVGVSLLFQGQFSLALHHFEQSIASYDPSEHGSLAYAAGQDRGVFSHSLGGWCHASRGHPDQALALSQEGVVVARRIEHPFSLAQALGSGGVVLFERREVDRVRERYEELLVLSERLGFPFWVAFARAARGWARVESGEDAAGIEEMQLALAQLDEIESEVCMPMLISWHAESLGKVGRYNEALRALEQGLARAEAAGQHYYDAELHRLRAEILLDTDSDATEEAEALFARSLEIARQQEAKAFELRAATSLARRWQREGKRDEARGLLRPAYDWFTEGFDTQDLKNAKALLEELAEPPIHNI